MYIRKHDLWVRVYCRAVWATCR